MSAYLIVFFAVFQLGKSISLQLDSPMFVSELVWILLAEKSLARAPDWNRDLKLDPQVKVKLMLCYLY